MNQRVVCVYGRDGLEKFACRTLARYLGAMTGVRPTVARRIPRSCNTILAIGRSACLRDLLARGLVSLPVDLSTEGFIARNVRVDEREVLLLCGGGPRGTFNAVTWYLETACRIGFFWDGERVPSRDRIPVEGIDVHEEPRWPERQYLISVAYTYSAWWWGWREWKREIEWAARHRYNIMTCPPGAVAVWQKVWRRYGVRVPPEGLSGPPYLMFASAHQWRMLPPYPRRFQRTMDRLTRRMLTWGRFLGIRWDSPVMAGVQLPRELAEAWRGSARIMEIPWAGFPPAVYLHPLDQRYGEMLRAFAKAYRRRYGTDHFWWLPSFFEMEIGAGDDPGRQLELKVEIARRTLEAFRAVDPQAVLVCIGWTFAVRKYWPKEHVRAFLESLPDDGIRIWDLWQDFQLGSPDVPKPLYEELDFYFGKPWLMGFLHSFGGSTTLHGDLAGTVARVKSVADDPRASACRGVNVQTEVVHHNPLFHDLLSRLAWNPKGISLEAFLPEYAERRYGSAAAAMLPCLQELAQSVYATPDITSPLYQLRIEEQMLRPDFRYEREPSLLTLAERWTFLPRLARALAIALEAAPLLLHDAMFEHDLLDIARQYLGDLFNKRIVHLGSAFRAGDRSGFEEAARSVAAVLDAQDRVLSASTWFHLQPLLDKAQRLPGVPRDYSCRVRNMLTVWIDRIPDYARRDYWELVRFCYRPRVDVLIDHLRERLAAGIRSAEEGELKGRYIAIERAFIEGRYAECLSRGPFPDPVSAAKSAHDEVP